MYEDSNSPKNGILRHVYLHFSARDYIRVFIQLGYGNLSARGYFQASAMEKHTDLVRLDPGLFQTTAGRN